MYKIIGYINGGYYSPEGNFINEIKKEYKSRFKLTFTIKLFFVKLFYDWAEVEYE